MNRLVITPVDQGWRVKSVKVDSEIVEAAIAYWCDQKFDTGNDRLNAACLAWDRFHAKGVD